MRLHSNSFNSSALSTGSQQNPVTNFNFLILDLARENFYKLSGICLQLLMWWFHDFHRAFQLTLHVDFTQYVNRYAAGAVLLCVFKWISDQVN